MAENNNILTPSKDGASPGGEQFSVWPPDHSPRADMVEVAAYRMAERSNFTRDPRDCWIAAEAQMEAMLSLAEKQQQLQTIMDSALDAVVMIDADGIITAWNPQAEKIFGWSKNEAIGQTLQATIMPPRHREAHERGLGQCLLTGEGPMLSKLVETQAVNRAGREFHVELTITPLQSEDKPAFSAFIRDITERRRVEDVQKARIRLMEYATNHTLKELLVATLDEAGLLTDSPIGFYHFLEADQKTLFLQAWSTRTTREFCTAGGEGSHYNIDQAGVWVECVRVRAPVIHNDYAALPNKRGLPPGHAEVLREMVVPVFRKGSIVAILGVGNKPLPYVEYDLETVSLLADLAWDFAENKRMEVELREMATTDFLTGLYNRRHFMGRMEDELARLKRHDTQCASVLMLDLDRFKNINDTLGHSAGDLVLKHFAAIVQAELRKIDTAGRIGGEEFAILLPGSDAEAAQAFAERLRQKVSDTPAAREGKSIPATVSIGISALRAGDAAPDAALIRADQALYRAKEGGRNRVEVAGGN
jgi:diguanylate cyclase (GGDEF)-like protein/PAS domain S-box-containing protein